jgi:hypothetical protein
VRVFRLPPGVAENSVIQGYGAGSLGNQILKFRGSAVSSISRDTSTPGEKGITSYRNVGISLPIYATSYPRRFPVSALATSTLRRRGFGFSHLEISGFSSHDS